MAEIAAGALVAEQVVSTGVEAGVAVAIARPTQPLKASLNQIAAAPAEDTSLALARSHHSVTVIGNKAYIFGGEKADGQLCSTDVHAIAVPSDESPAGASEYACYPAVPMRDVSTGDILAPAPRSRHAACARGNTLIVHGGRGHKDTPIEDQSSLWVWDSETLGWSRISAATLEGSAPPARSDHGIFLDEGQDILVLHGGQTDQPQMALQTWLFDFKTSAWTELPPAPSVPLSSALVNETLYSVGGSSDVSGSIHFLKLGASERKSGNLQWSRVDFPSNPLRPGPRPRVGSALVPVTTGLGRNYLVHLLGSREDADITSDKEYTEEHPFYSDIWALQLPSKGLSGANVKDAVRSVLPGVDSGSFSWAEIEIEPTEQTQAAGKVHPGPRGFFGADACAGGRGVVLWGGINAKREAESDGWRLKID